MDPNKAGSRPLKARRQASRIFLMKEKASGRPGQKMKKVKATGSVTFEAGQYKATSETGGHGRPREARQW